MIHTSTHKSYAGYAYFKQLLLAAVSSLLFFTPIFAQQPAYFILGEEQFRGIQIYDVIQDKELNYLFATNEGIYYYNYHDYEKIECEQAKSNAVFNFMMNDVGTIYCHNLNNQIFQLNGKNCSLFYELKQEEGTSDVGLAIADDGNLLISCKKIIVVNKKGEAILNFDSQISYIGPPFTLKTGAVQFHYSTNGTICVYSKGKFTQYPLNINGKGVFKFFNLHNQSYAFNLNNQELYTYNQKTYKLTAFPKTPLLNREHSVRIYETGNDVWTAGSLPGVSFFNGPVGQTKNDLFYPDYFISNVYQDHEGNILLATFDKGVLVVPDVKVPDVIHSFRDDPVTAMHSDPVKGLILGTSKGKLFNYIQGELNAITQEASHPIEGIYGSPNSNLVLFDDGKIRAYNHHTGQITNLGYYSLKDAAIVSKNEFYLGTNVGIFKVAKNARNVYILSPVTPISQRIYSLAYNPVNHCLYSSTASGLYILLPNGNSEKITFQQTDIFPNYLYYDGGKIWASSKKNGVLIIENKKITGVIHPRINGKLQELKKIHIHKGTLIGNSTNGLFQFNMEGELLSSISSSTGSSNRRIFDFTFHNNELWVSHGGGVQQIHLNHSGSNTTTPPPIRFHNIMVNDQPVDYTQPGHLKSSQRKIQFIFSSPTLRNQATMRYQYKLVGYDSQWNILQNETREITYNALAPGNYQLQVRAENQGKLSEPITWSFSIASPFYARWWFITLGVIIFLGIVFMLYRWQLKIQRKKSQQMAELNASKLTAIQSQMNPHFIFNSLNSIQDLILKGDVEHSYSYITTFSNLVRRTLNYSEKDFIDFEQEIKLLELYLSLEKLRYKKDLNYQIETNQVADIMLPPLLIQPFIENALVHGLLHKEGKKNLYIKFELKEVLVCTIEDNGIGREQAKAIQQRQRADHESFSGKAIHQRFEILSHVFKNQFGYTYQDLYKNNQPTGTRVTITIPIKRKF